MYEIVCGRVGNPCAFRVHERYFHDKPRFGRRSCPNCGGSLMIVDIGTDNPVLGSVSLSTGLVVLKGVETA